MLLGNGPLIMSDEVNVFMDPYLKIYTKADQIAVADALVESFNEDIVLREQQRNTELESVKVIESKLSKAMRKESDKPKQSNYSARDIVESKLNDVKERERQKERKEKKKEKEAEKEVIKIEKPVDRSEEAEVSNVTMLQKKKFLEEENKQTKAEDLCSVTTVAHTEQKQEKAINTEERRESIIDVPLQMTLKWNGVDNEEVTCRLQPESSMIREADKTKGPECFKFDNVEEQHDATIVKVPSAETPGDTNPTELKQPKNEQYDATMEKVHSTEAPGETKLNDVKQPKDEQHDATIEKVQLTETPGETNPTKVKQPKDEQNDATIEKVQSTETPVETKLIDVKQPKDEVKAMEYKKELSITETCQDAVKSQSATNDADQCKTKETMCLQSDNTEYNKKINTKPETQEYEHLYEVPDILLTSSAEYVHKTDEHMRERFKQLDNVSLHIAVTGSTGAGKSSFINAIRGLKPDDKNAAPTGVTETTMISTMYAHPTMPNVKLWDLPGTGSPRFKAKKYLKEVKLETYDFFIIISSERFKENDIMLAKAIKEKKKIFYFLRSKVDNDIEAESQRKDFDEQKVLSQIRDDCQKNLREMNNPKIFLISSFDLNKYDFQALTDTLSKELPTHKRDALILSLPIYSSKILEEKINTFMNQTCSAAIASGSIAVAPVPGLSMACDAAILLSFFTKCYYAFGLDDDSIDKLSLRVNNPSLKSVRSSPLVVAIGQKKLSTKELSALTSKEAAVKFAWSMVPGIGSKKAAEMSYNVTLNLLRAGLQDLADTAKEVLKAAGVAEVY